MSQRPRLWWIRWIKCLLTQHVFKLPFTQFKREGDMLALPVPSPFLTRCSRCGRLGRVLFETRGKLLLCRVEVMRRER